MDQEKYFHPEKPKTEKEKIEKNLKRIEELIKKDDPGRGEDSLWDLANEEGLFRKFLEEEYGKDSAEPLSERFKNAVADRHSDKMLESIEKEKAIRIDGLTGLRNRKALFEEGPKVLAREKREGNSCSVLMIDLDHFGEINKKYGFLSGDQTLKAVAAVIEKNIRSSDFVYRVGGEEFVVVLPGQGIRAAYEAAERIREAVSKNSVEIKDSVGNPVTIRRGVSVGCASSEQVPEQSLLVEGKAPEGQLLVEMIRRSDRALREAKAGGRNQTVVFDEKRIEA